jgi:uncharacterized membrane protein YcaP (DUF421 family)
MSWLIGNHAALWQAAAKAVLMYATALVALRLGERRTLAQWTIIDFATAVAMGAIIGRTAIARQGYAAGAVAVCTLVIVHRIASILRFRPWLGKVVDHRVRILVAYGRVRHDQLRKCGLTDNDLYTQLRQRGVFALDNVRYVLYESKGSITVVPEDAPDDAHAPLVRAGLEDSAGYP